MGVAAPCITRGQIGAAAAAGLCAHAGLFAAAWWQGYTPSWMHGAARGAELAMLACASPPLLLGLPIGVWLERCGRPLEDVLEPGVAALAMCMSGMLLLQLFAPAGDPLAVVITALFWLVFAVPMLFVGAWLAAGVQRARRRRHGRR